jgi:hypothetical protein
VGFSVDRAEAVQIGERCHQVGQCSIGRSLSVSSPFGGQAEGKFEPQGGWGRLSI